MSALLTTTMPYMKVVIETLKDRGIRDDYIVLVGGAPLNEEFGAAVGADAYCRDAGGRRRDRPPAHRRAPRQCGLSGLSRLPGRACPPTPRRVLVIGCGALARELRGGHRPGRARRRRPDLPAGDAAQPAGRHPGRRSRRRSAPPEPRLRPDLRRLRRLRDGRPARPRARGTKASSASPAPTATSSTPALAGVRGA